MQTDLVLFSNAVSSCWVYRQIHDFQGLYQVNLDLYANFHKCMILCHIYFNSKIDYYL